MSASLANNEFPEGSLQNLNNALQFEFELEIQKTFHTVAIKFCSRFIATLKMSHHVQIDRIENPIQMEIKVLFPNSLCFGNKYKNCIFYELNTEGNKIL